jgi:hypothetical protein
LWLIESVVIASGTLLSAPGLIIHGLFSAFQAGNAYFVRFFAARCHENAHSCMFLA